MAIQAGGGRVPVQTDHLSVLLLLFVTLGTGHSAVSGIQCKSRLTVIKICCIPGLLRMTRGTIPIIPLFAKLAAVWFRFGVAFRALVSISGENRCVSRFRAAHVALNAGNGAGQILVYSFGLGSGAGMIERAQGLPRLWSVASLARQICLRAEFMRIGVTHVAGSGRQVEPSTVRRTFRRKKRSGRRSFCRFQAG
jgi:hypothetical protein